MQLEFKMGETYTHASGEQVTIVGTMLSNHYGLCLIGETDKSRFVPIGVNEDSSVYWKKELKNLIDVTITDSKGESAIKQYPFTVT